MSGGTSLIDLVKALGGDTRNLRLGASIGQVVDNDDPDGLGGVLMAFNWDYQGTHTASRALPIYPLAGDLGMSVPEVGDFLLCLFLDGNPTEPFYLGRTRGKPQKTDTDALHDHNGDNLGIAVAEAVSGMLGDILQWMKSHTHSTLVTPQGIGNLGAPIIGTPVTYQSMASQTPVPKLRNVKAARVRLHKRNDPDAAEQPTGGSINPDLLSRLP